MNINIIPTAKARIVLQIGAILALAAFASACGGKGKGAEEGKAGKGAEAVGEVINEPEEGRGDIISDPDVEGAGASVAAEPEEKPIIDITQVSDGQIQQAWSAASNVYSFDPFPFYDTYGFFEMRGDNGVMSYGLGRLDNLEGSTMRANGEVLSNIAKETYRQAKKGKDLSGWLQPFLVRVASSIPAPTYISCGWDNTVRQLLVAYDDIAARNAFGEVYKVMADVHDGGEDSEYRRRWHTASSAYSEITKFARDRKFRAFVIKACETEYSVSVGEVNPTAVVWAYSFWGRRHNENPNNVKPIAAALREVQKRILGSETKAAAAAASRIGRTCAGSTPIPSSATAFPPKGSEEVLPEGNIATQHGTAWYKFATTGSAEYYVFWDARSTRFGADNLADVMVEVYDSNGKLLTRSHKGIQGYDGRASLTLNGGETFYIRVIRLSENGSAFRISYDDCTDGCG